MILWRIAEFVCGLGIIAAWFAAINVAIVLYAIAATAFLGVVL